MLAADYHDALTRLTLQAVGGDSARYYLTKAEFYGVKNDIPGRMPTMTLPVLS